MLITHAFRDRESNIAANLVVDVMRGLTRVRLWRMALLEFKMRLSSGKGSVGNFITQSSYFALEENGQAVLLYCFFHCIIRGMKPALQTVSLNEAVTDRLEFRFGKRRTSNRIGGENFSAAQIVYETGLETIADDSLTSLLDCGMARTSTRKKQVLYSRMHNTPSSAPAAHPENHEPVPFPAIEADMLALIEKGVQVGIEDCMTVPQWQSCFHDASSLKSKLQAEYKKGFSRILPDISYPADTTVASENHILSVESSSLSEAMWTHRYDIFPSSSTDSDEARIGSSDTNECENESGDHENIVPEAVVLEASATIRMFMNEAQSSDLLNREFLSFYESRNLLKKATTFREFVSKDRQKRFNAGVMPGNTAITGRVLSSMTSVYFQQEMGSPSLEKLQLFALQERMLGLFP